MSCWQAFILLLFGCWSCPCLALECVIPLVGRGAGRPAAVQVHHHQSCPHYRSCIMQHDSKTPFNAVMASEPGLQVLSRLSGRDLLCLASTCHLCKEAVSYAILPKAKDVSEAQESAPIPCRFTLADLAALLEPLRGSGQVSLGQACQSFGACDFASHESRPIHMRFRSHLLGFTYTKHNRFPRKLTMGSEVAGCACDPMT